MLYIKVLMKFNHPFSFSLTSLIPPLMLTCHAAKLVEVAIKLMLDGPLLLTAVAVPILPLLFDLCSDVLCDVVQRLQVAHQ